VKQRTRHLETRVGHACQSCQSFARGAVYIFLGMEASYKSEPVPPHNTARILLIGGVDPLCDGQFSSDINSFPALGRRAGKRGPAGQRLASRRSRETRTAARRRVRGRRKRNPWVLCNRYT
jgi:hypothetical protein